MPVTPLHYPVAWGLSKLDKRLNLPGLIVGSFLPDIEVPFLFIFFKGVLPDHLILHSLIGAVTIGTIISTFVTIILYPILTSLLFRLDRVKIKEVCRISPVLVLSCMMGNLFHIFLDVFMHRFNSILWPFVDPNEIVGILTLAFAYILEGNIVLGSIYASVLLHSIFVLLMIAIVVKCRRNLWERILVGKHFETSYGHKR